MGFFCHLRLISFICLSLKRFGTEGDYWKLSWERRENIIRLLLIQTIYNIVFIVWSYMAYSIFRLYFRNGGNGGEWVERKEGGYDTLTVSWVQVKLTLLWHRMTIRENPVIQKSQLISFSWWNFCSIFKWSMQEKINISLNLFSDEISVFLTHLQRQCNWSTLVINFEIFL